MIARLVAVCLFACSCATVQSQDLIQEMKNQDLTGADFDKLLEKAKTMIVEEAVKKKVDDARTAAEDSISGREDNVWQLNNLRRITLALLNFESANGYFPARHSCDENGKILLSWRVHILPFMDHDELYRKFRLDEPWNSPHNKKLISSMPPLYSASNLVESTSSGETPYLAIEHNRSVLTAPTTPMKGLGGHKIDDIKKGTSNTIVVVHNETGKPVPWTQPTDLRVQDKDPLADLWNKKGILKCAMVDGSIRQLKKSDSSNMQRTVFVEEPRRDGQPEESLFRSGSQSSTNYSQAPADANFLPAEAFPTRQVDAVSNQERSLIKRGYRAPTPASPRAVPASPQPLMRPSNQPVARPFTDNTYRYQLDIQELQNDALLGPDEKTREQILSELQALLEKSFDESIEAQAIELESLEKRVADLKAAFEKRKSNRDRVIENYVDRIRLQAEGLTIPSSMPQATTWQFDRRVQPNRQLVPSRAPSFLPDAGYQRQFRSPVPTARPTNAVGPRAPLPATVPSAPTPSGFSPPPPTKQ